MSNNVVVYEGTPVAEEYKEVATHIPAPKSVFVVRWNEHEYEAGWGVNDNESHLDIFKTMEDAQKDVEDHFKHKGKRTLYGAGDYFIYPSGPDNAYHVFEIFPPENYPLYAFLEEYHTVSIGRYPREKAWEIIRKDVTMAMQNSAKLTVVPFEGLSPKPMTGEPTTIYFSSEPARYSEIAEPLPALQ